MQKPSDFDATLRFLAFLAVLGGAYYAVTWLAEEWPTGFAATWATTGERDGD